MPRFGFMEMYLSSLKHFVNDLSKAVCCKIGPPLWKIGQTAFVKMCEKGAFLNYYFGARISPNFMKFCRIGSSSKTLQGTLSPMIYPHPTPPHPTLPQLLSHPNEYLVQLNENSSKNHALEANQHPSHCNPIVTRQP